MVSYARVAFSKLRNSNYGLVAFCSLAGVIAGFTVFAMTRVLHAVHAFVYGIPYGSHLSSATGLPHWRVAFMPILGGLLVGGATLLMRRYRRADIIDAIEANALYGGRMSLRDSLNLAAVTILSGGFGASVGMEAAYTQMGASLGSRLGRIINLRRDDLRTLVGCGAAGAIAAAFNAPLAGAFYAFELIIGSYAPANLASVAGAALGGTLVQRALVGEEPIFTVLEPVSIAPLDYALFFVMGLGAALLSILVMRGVSGIERLFRRAALPAWARPAIGGGFLGVIACVYPEVLGSGHGAMVTEFRTKWQLLFLAGLLVAKAAASAISIGSGFRGGLFSSSLFLGSIFGSLAGKLLETEGYVADPLAFVLVGMGSVAAGVVGAPITMILLVLETTSDFSATLGVMVGVISSSFAVRQWFGYSFATWRFHLRGLRITSAEDIGWADDIKVGRLMTPQPPTVPLGTHLGALGHAFPPGSGVRSAFVVDAGGMYRGMVDLAEALQPNNGLQSTDEVDGLLEAPEAFLLPRQGIRQAIALFQETGTEILPVLNNETERRIVGAVNEAHALRRYTRELERMRGALPDASGVYSPER